MRRFARVSAVTGEAAGTGKADGAPWCTPQAPPGPREVTPYLAPPPPPRQAPRPSPSVQYVLVSAVGWGSLGHKDTQIYKSS